MAMVAKSLSERPAVLRCRNRAVYRIRLARRRSQQRLKGVDTNLQKMAISLFHF